MNSQRHMLAGIGRVWLFVPLVSSLCSRRVLNRCYWDASYFFIFCVLTLSIQTFYTLSSLYFCLTVVLLSLSLSLLFVSFKMYCTFCDVFCFDFIPAAAFRKCNHPVSCVFVFACAFSVSFSFFFPQRCLVKRHLWILVFLVFFSSVRWLLLWWLC